MVSGQKKRESKTLQMHTLQSPRNFELAENVSCHLRATNSSVTRLSPDSARLAALKNNHMCFKQGCQRRPTLVLRMISHTPDSLDLRQAVAK